MFWECFVLCGQVPPILRYLPAAARDSTRCSASIQRAGESNGFCTAAGRDASEPRIGQLDHKHRSIQHRSGRVRSQTPPRRARAAIRTYFISQLAVIACVPLPGITITTYTCKSFRKKNNSSRSTNSEYSQEFFMPSRTVSFRRSKTALEANLVA